MLTRLNGLFRKPRCWFNETRNVVPVKRHLFQPRLESLDERVVPTGIGQPVGGSPVSAITNYYWTGAAGTNDGSNVNNWSTVSNAQTPPAAAPGANAALYFSDYYGDAENYSDTSCQLTGASYGSINTTSAYTMTISDTQAAVTFSVGSSVEGGTINTGTATANKWTFTSTAAIPATPTAPAVNATSNTFGTPGSTVTFSGGGTIGTAGTGTSTLNSVSTADNLILGDSTDTFTSISFTSTLVGTTVNAGTTLVTSTAGATYSGLFNGSTWANPITLNGGTATVYATLSVVANATVNTYINDNGAIIVTGSNTLTMTGQTEGSAITGSGSVSMDTISVINLGTVSGVANWMSLSATNTSTGTTGLFITRNANTKSSTSGITGNVWIEGTSTNQALLAFKDPLAFDSLFITGELDMGPYSTISMYVNFSTPASADGITCGSLEINVTGTVFNVTYAGDAPQPFTYYLINDTGTLTGKFSMMPPQTYTYQWSVIDDNNILTVSNQNPNPN